jgi:hypothetical protein
MPKGESWWNPYRFVPVRGQVERRAPNTDEKFQGQTGSLECSLNNISLLFIGGGSQGQDRFISRQNRPFIPGSSLKGMLRSLAEIVGGGCFVAPSDHSCTDARNLCVACRMFGMLHRGDVHKGQVSISDGELQDERPQWRQVSILQGQPKKEHRSFYKHPLTGEWAQNMMKMYFHQPQRTRDVLPVPGPLQQRAVSKQMLAPGHTFTFKVHFENLEDEELDLLLYILALEEQVSVTLRPDELEPITLQGPMLHKLGNAKGQGPGSCRIAVQEMHLLPLAAQRFSSLDRSGWKSWKGVELRTEISNRTQKYKQGEEATETMQFLRKMMVWDEKDARTFRYPEYSWFKSEMNKYTELKSI